MEIFDESFEISTNIFYKIDLENPFCMDFFTDFTEMVIARIICGNDLSTNIEDRDPLKLNEIKKTIDKAVENAERAVKEEERLKRCKFYRQELPRILETFKNQKDENKEIMRYRNYAFEYNHENGMKFI